MASNSNSRRMLKSANPSTIQNKFMVGYQGWFTCPGDGEPVGPGHHGWLHWFNYPIPDGGRPNTDVWPDVSGYSPSELFPAPGLKTASGEQTFLFSSRNAKTVQRHFHWMAEHGVDGAFLQRFAGQCDLESGNQGIMRIRDEVGERVREAAEREGRVFAIMYDVSGVPADRIQRILERDWVHLVHELGVLDSPNYLREKGKPVIALWGFGFERAGHTPALVRAITQFFRNNTPGSVYIMGGTPTHWRTGEGDADRNPEFLQVWLDEFDAISPWTIGRYSTEQDADNFAKTKMKGDWELISNRNQEDSTRKVDYIPVVLPGGSGYNLSEGKWGFNDIKRQGGRFLWRQIYNAHQLGIHTIYGAMWDEYDEGTAFMPIVEHKRNLPVSDKYRFLSLDEDGFDVPSDWYMRICGLAAEGLRNERRIHETFPVKELQDYWSSRPKYEDVNPKSKEFRSGSLLSNKADDIGEDPEGGGQTYQEWLALQKEEKEEVPPPPYTLEGDEPIPPQTVTVTDADMRTSTVAAAPLRNSPTVANVQPPVSSSHAAARPAVDTNTHPASHAASSSYAVLSSSIPAASPLVANINSYPTSAAPASRQEAYSQVSPHSSQLSHPPAQGHSPGGVHHPQSPPSSQRHSPQPYPPGVSQHPQSVSPSQGHSQISAQSSQQSYSPAQGYSPGGVHHPQSPPSSQRHSPQPYPPGISQHPQSVSPSQGHSQISAQSSQQSYSPAQGYSPGGVHHPQSPPSSQGHSPQPYPPGVSQHSQSNLPSHSHSPQSYPAVSGQPVQSYPPHAGPQHQQPYQVQTFPPYPPNSGQAPVWGQQPQPYAHGGGPSYQGYPTSTGHSQGYPLAGAPSQGYTSPIAQSYPTNGGPVRQGYPPVDVQGHPSNHNTCQIHNQSQDSVAALTNEFGRQSISGPSGASSGGRLPSPPPLHPTHSGRRTSSSSLKPSSSFSRPSSGGRLPSPPPLHPAHPNRPPRPPSSSLKPSTPSNLPSRPQSQTGHHHAAPVSSSSGQVTSTQPTSTNRPRWPPAEWESDTPPVQQFLGRRPSASNGVSSSNPTGGSTLRPTHGHSDNHANPPSFPAYDQYVTFPSAQYNMPSGYPDQHGAMAYGSWTGSGRVSPPPTFPGSSMGYGVPEPSYVESQYPGGPTFPSTGSAAGGERLHFPEGPGGSYYDASSQPVTWASTSEPPMHSPSHHSSGALGLALSAVDKMAGRKARDKLESQVGHAAQSKLFDKLTKKDTR